MAVSKVMLLTADFVVLVSDRVKIPTYGYCLQLLLSGILQYNQSILIMKFSTLYRNRLCIVAFLLFAVSAFAQKEADYTNWFFVQSDKAMQVRYALVKQEGDMGQYSVQFRINQEDGIFCKSADCEGYVMAFSYPTADNSSSIYHHFIFYNTFKGVYTMKSLMPIKNKFADGSKRFLSKTAGMMYELANGQQGTADVFYNCVDEKLKSTTKTRCEGSGSYRNIFKTAEAIIVK